MRLVNRCNDPNCEQIIPTWSPTVQVAVTQDGRHWKYSITKGSLIPQKMSDCLLLELTPASVWISIIVENSALLCRSSDGLMVVDISKESRNVVGIRVLHDTLEVTPIGMCFIGLSEWPILQEVGARIFAADTAPY